MTQQGRPMSEAPRDGTVILVENMNYSGVQETGGHSFQRMKKDPRGDWWIPEDQDSNSDGGSFYGETSLLRWFPAETDPAKLTLTPRTNWCYVPSNGSAGEGFYESWCERCIRERPIREDYDNAVANGLGCDIYLRSMAFKISDPEYPKEWTYFPDMVPKCTAFELDTGQPKQEPRCRLTKEMFGGTTEEQPQ